MSELFIPTEGPCAGHPCDNCWTCRQGRCCRRDNPDYKLPELGEWDGPIHGRIGAVDDTGETIQCHICGEFFSFLGGHIRLHDVTPEEYRAIFGLAKGFGLASTDYKQKHRSMMINRPGAIERIRQLGKEWTASLTPEQRSHFQPSKRRMQANESSSVGLRERYKTTLSASIKLSEEDIMEIRSIDPRPSCKQSFRELAQRYGVSIGTIQRVLYMQVAQRIRPEVLPMPPDQKSYAKLSPSLIDQITKRVNQGERQRDIAESLGISQGTVSNAVTGRYHKRHAEEVAA